MAEPFREILAIIEQNKAKTEAVATLEKRLQNLQETSVKQYAAMQEKDRELAEVQLELQQNQEKIELVAFLEKQVQNVQEANKQHLAEMLKKDQELEKLELKLDNLAAKRQDKREEDDDNKVPDNYWQSLAEMQDKIRNLDATVMELGDSVSNFDGKLEVEDNDSSTYEKMKKDHEHVRSLLRRKEEVLLDLKRKYEANVEKLKKDKETKTGTIKQLQQQVYDKTVQLSSAQTALSLSHERLAVVKPEWMENKQQVDSAYRN